MLAPRSALLPLLLAALAAGCATAPVGSTDPAGAAEVRDQLFKLQKDSARILEKLDQVTARDDDRSTAACAAAASKVDDLATEVRALEEQVLATQRRLDELFSEVRALRRAGPTAWAAAPATPPQAGPAGDASPAAGEAASAGSEASAGQGQPGQPTAEAAATPATPSESPVDVFNRAYADFSQAHFDLALAGFQRVLQLDPNGPLSDDAQYWIGETWYAMGRYDEAAAAFDHLISAWPRSDKLRAAHLKKGLALFEGRRTTEGAMELQELIETWPDSDEARIAEEYLRRKGIR